MNRLNVLTVSVALAAACGWSGGTARADHASLSVHTGGVALAIDAGDAGPAPDTSDVTDVDVSPDAGPDLNARPFVPDVFPSRFDAARALGERWAAGAVRPGQVQPSRVRVMSDDPALFVPVREGIRSKFVKMRVEPCDGTLCRGRSAPDGEAWLYVTLPGGNAMSIHSTGAYDAAATAAYVDKAWLSNFAAFVSQTPGRWAVAHSDFGRPATTLADAAREARRAAVDQVVPLVMARLRNARRYDEGSVRQIVERHVMGDRLVTDRFPQKFERPYGSVYRESVLVDASDERLDPLAREVRATLDGERRTRLGGLASAGAVLLVTYALYRFANAFTRGYFTWSLRTAAALAAAGAVVLIVAVA